LLEVHLFDLIVIFMVSMCRVLFFMEKNCVMNNKFASLEQLIEQIHIRLSTG